MVTMSDTTITTDKQTALRALREEFKGTAAKSQCHRLLEALRRFPLTTFEAMRELDVYHVPARILQLRRAGHVILTLWQTVITEAGVRHRVGLYVLKRGNEDEASS